MKSSNQFTVNFENQLSNIDSQKKILKNKIIALDLLKSKMDDILVTFNDSAEFFKAVTDLKLEILELNITPCGREYFGDNPTDKTAYITCSLTSSGFKFIEDSKYTKKKGRSLADKIESKLSTEYFNVTVNPFSLIEKEEGIPSSKVLLTIRPKF